MGKCKRCIGVSDRHLLLFSISIIYFPLISSLLKPDHMVTFKEQTPQVQLLCCLLFIIVPSSVAILRFEPHRVIHGLRCRTKFQSISQHQEASTVTRIRSRDPEAPEDNKRFECDMLLRLLFTKNRTKDVDVHLCGKRWRWFSAVKRTSNKDNAVGFELYLINDRRLWDCFSSLRF